MPEYPSNFMDDYAKVGATPLLNMLNLINKGIDLYQYNYNGPLEPLDIKTDKQRLSELEERVRQLEEQAKPTLSHLIIPNDAETSFFGNVHNTLINIKQLDISRKAMYTMRKELK